MSKESMIFLLGLLVFMTPFLGIPTDWKEWTLIAAGILVMLLGYVLRRAAFLRSLDSGQNERKSDAFVESVPPEVQPEIFEEPATEV